MIDSIKLFYDDQCGFCTRSVLFIIRFLNLSEKILFKGSSDNVIKKILEEENSWILIDSNGNKWMRFSVFQQLVKSSPRFQWASFLISIKAVSYIGNWTYLFIARNRGKFSDFVK